MNLPIVDYSIIYNKKDISRDVSGQLINIQYTDKISGESDSLEITLEDSDLLWQNSWYPEKGDSINLIIRFEGRQLDCGLFEVDELASNGSIDGDKFIVRALAAGISKKLRTKNSYAHEDKSLREIANTIAAKLGLTIVGKVPEIRIHRVNQYRESDLAFLSRIGKDYGCIFSVRDTKLIFTHYLDLENRGASLVLSKQQLISYDLRDTTNKTFKNTRVRHHDPYKKQTVSYFSKADDDTGTQSADDLEIRSRVENEQQAEAKGKYALFKSNTEGVSGDIVLPGSLLFLSGNNMQLNGAGRMSGIYHILESTHTINRDGGYQTAGNIKRVKPVDSVNFKTN